MKGELKINKYKYREVTSSFNLPKYFKFCYLCFQEDLQKYGEAYWHRLHQVPSVLVCPIHTVALSDSTALIRDKNWHEVSAASQENCVLITEREIYPQSTLQKLLLLAKDIQWLITRDLSELPSKELDWFHTQYIAWLIKKGLSKKSRWIYWQDITDSFVEFYGKEFLEVIGINSSNADFLLRRIIQVISSLFDPVMHLLMIRFLTNSLERFFLSELKYNPFGEGPWPCLNPASVHYLKPVVTKLVMHPFGNWSSLLPHLDISAGTFSCDCGFIYSRNGPDTTDLDKFKFEFINAYGQLWEPFFHQRTIHNRKKLEAFAYKFVFSDRSDNNSSRLTRLEALLEFLNHNGQIDDSQFFEN